MRCMKNGSFVGFRILASSANYEHSWFRTKGNLRPIGDPITIRVGQPNAWNLPYTYTYVEIYSVFFLKNNNNKVDKNSPDQKTLIH